MEFSIRTDLALEQVPKSASEQSQKDYEVNSLELYGLDIIDVRIKSENGERLFRRKKGSYVTIITGIFYDIADPRVKNTTLACSKILRSFIEKSSHGHKSILVVGLGNKFITSDALGAICVDKIAQGGALDNVFLLTPGVPVQSGMQTLELIKCALKASGASCVILIDALASRNLDRLCSTIQISDTGLAPGSGTGAFKQEINQHTLGVPVISIGVPTVVGLSNIFYDAFEGFEEKKVPTCVNNLLKSYSELFVSPKDIDLTISVMSSIISDSIRLAIKKENPLSK